MRASRLALATIVLYPLLKVLHLLGVVVWVGGMFFALVFLQPAARAVLEGPVRLRLLQATQRRFLDGVALAVLVVFVSGATMIGMAWRSASAASLPFNMPLDWYAMVGAFVVMLAVFAHVRLALLPRAARALEAGEPAQAARWMERIRTEVLVNLVLGGFVIVVVGLGGSA